MQIRVAQMIRVVSQSSSLPGTETSLQMEISFINVNFICKRGHLYFIFRHLHGGKELFLPLSLAQDNTFITAVDFAGT